MRTYTSHENVVSFLRIVLDFASLKLKEYYEHKGTMFLFLLFVKNQGDVIAKF